MGGHVSKKDTPLMSDVNLLQRVRETRRECDRLKAHVGALQRENAELRRRYNAAVGGDLSLPPLPPRLQWRDDLL